VSRYGFFSTQKLYYSLYICVTICGLLIALVGIYCSVGDILRDFPHANIYSRSDSTAVSDLNQ
jgi:hypothetical protein